MLPRAKPPKTSWTIIDVSGAGSGGTVRAARRPADAYFVETGTILPWRHVTRM